MTPRAKKALEGSIRTQEHAEQEDEALELLAGAIRLQGAVDGACSEIDRLRAENARLVEALRNIHNLILSYPKHFNAHEVNLETYLSDAGNLLRELGVFE